MRREKNATRAEPSTCAISGYSESTAHTGAACSSHGFELQLGANPNVAEGHSLRH